MSKGYKHIDEKEFSKFKTLQEAGLTRSQAAKIMQRSNSVATTIYASETFEDYKNAQRESLQRSFRNRGLDEHGKKIGTATSEEKVTPIEKVETPEALKGRTHFSEDSVNLERIATAMEKSNELLERLAIAWESSPKKRSLF